MKHLATALIGCAVIILTACTTTPSVSPKKNVNNKTKIETTQSIETTQEMASLMVSRIRTLPIALKPRILIDGNEVGRLKNGEYLKVPIHPGSRELKIKFNPLSMQKGAKMDLEVQPGQTYAFNIGSGMGSTVNSSYVEVGFIPTSQNSVKNCCTLLNQK